jgi:hypothetical protein
MLGHRHTASQVRLVLILVFAVGLAALVGLTASAGATASAGFSASAWSAASAMSAASGHLSWWYTEDSPAHALDAITAVAPGPNGSMYAAADMGDDWAAGADLVMYRFRPAFGKSGPMMWERTYNGPAHQADSPIAMVTDPAGNAIAAGQTATTATKIDWLIVKRSPSGAKEWIATWDGAGHDDDYLTGAACDGAGNVYACGMSVVGTSQYDAAVVKFRASDGKRLWKYVYAGPWTPQGRNWAHAIAVDASGNAYIAGQSDDSAGMPDILVMKLSPKGRVVWMRRVDGPAHLADYAEKIALRGRSVYVAAESSPVANSTSVMLLKYSTSGRRTWTRTWQDAPGITVSEIRALAVDGQGDPIVAGASLKATPFSKAFLVSWTPSGHQRRRRQRPHLGRRLHRHVRVHPGRAAGPLQQFRHHRLDADLRRRRPRRRLVQRGRPLGQGVAVRRRRDEHDGRLHGRPRREVHEVVRWRRAPTTAPSPGCSRASRPCATSP